MAKVTSDIHHANPIVVSVTSATGRAYTMLRYSAIVKTDRQGLPGIVSLRACCSYRNSKKEPNS